MRSLDGDSLLLTYYGDDFTGSTDVMEALTVRGLPTVLFLDPPTREDLGRFPGYRAAGVAGLSRSQSPEWMDANLPAVFEALRALNAPICHYKVCSTFDSSPRHGSIGRAIEIGRRVFGTATAPLVVGAPVLRRYVLFGNLFAWAAGEMHRIDRHPTMSRHPVTPMDEGDLRRHLARQTDLHCGLVDILALHSGRGAEQWERLRADGIPIALFDTLDAASLREAGRAIWDNRSQAPMFAAGSSGLEYALLAWWESLGILPPQAPPAGAGAVDRMLVVSGSCSPVTASQIQWALANGFTGVAIDAPAFAEDGAEFERALGLADQYLSEGRSPIVYSACGPADVTADATPQFRDRLGQRLGALAAELHRRHPLKRTVIAGGDTSGHAGHALRIQALTMIRPFAPGSPLCRMWSHEPTWTGREILLKGGQVGSETLFGEVRAGSPPSEHR